MGVDDPKWLRLRKPIKSKLRMRDQAWTAIYSLFASNLRMTIWGKLVVPTTAPRETLKYVQIGVDTRHQGTPTLDLTSSLELNSGIAWTRRQLSRGSTFPWT